MNSRMALEMLVRPETRSIRWTSSCSDPWIEAMEEPPDIVEDDMCMGPDAHFEMLLQPETRPISHNQLLIEVKGIYAGSVMVEAKCIDIDENQTATARGKDSSTQLKNKQYQSLIALHKQLLLEHHEFFLASQHPPASLALSRFAAKYSMPTRMWRRGIHTFLEVLRHRLPESVESMLTFIYVEYSMMALLYEAVPAFENTWIECLGDLGRYRMAIEDDESRDSEVWSNVARFWHNKAADNSPRVGRLYHHLAILARPYSLQQLSLYIRALMCPIPFESARGSVMTLFSPVLSGTHTTELGSSSLEVVFIKAHGNIFHGNPMIPRWNNYSGDYFLAEISKLTERNDYTAVANIAAILEHGFSRNEMSRRPLQRVYEDIPHRNFDGLEPLIDTGTQDESSTKHQLISTFPDLLRSALDQISFWNLRSTLRGKASGLIRWCPLRAASKLRGSLALTLTTCTNFVVPTTARTIPRNTSNEGSTGSFTAAVVPLAHWPCLAFVTITLLVAQYLAYMKDPIFVWGCMMTIWAFGWWTIRADTGTSLQISAVVLFLWVTSAYQYGHAAFSKHRIPTRAGIIIVISAMILDVTTVTLMTPSEASTAQSELLLSLILPLVSVILAAMVNMVAAMQSAEGPHHLEAALQVHVPYIQEEPLQRRHQRRFRMLAEAPSRPVELATTPGAGG